jgi:hypothetical protein
MEHVLKTTAIPIEKRKRRTALRQGLSKLLFGGGLLVLLAACQPYGDSADNLGIHGSNVSQGGLVGTWISSAGSSLEISQDSNFTDATCSQSGGIIYVSRYDNCPNGNTSCGSLTFSNAPYNQANGCRSAGQTVCTYFVMNTAASPAALTLSCADSISKINLSYQKM